MRILFFGDIFGKPGRMILLTHLRDIVASTKADFVIANAENLADGKGLTEKTLKPLFAAGVDAVTGGNHLWDREESHDFICREPRIVKPLNYPKSAPGHEVYTIRKNDYELDVISICGQIFMPPCNSPFEAFEGFLTTRIASRPLFLDMHAESSSEKRAMGWFVAGKATLMAGTHTHIQTADEEILPGGTAYITDVGMTGSHDSVIGVRKEIILEKLTTSVPRRFETSDRGLMVNAIIVEANPDSGQAVSIERLRYKVEV